MVWVCKPWQHIRLSGFPQRHGIVEERAMLLADDGDSGLNLGTRERVKWMGWSRSTSDMLGDLLQTIENHDI